MFKYLLENGLPTWSRLFPTGTEAQPGLYQPECEPITLIFTTVAAAATSFDDEGREK